MSTGQDCVAAAVYRKGRAALAKSDGTPVARHVYAMLCEGYGMPQDPPVRYGAEVILHRRGQLVPAHGRKAPGFLAPDAARLSCAAGLDDSETLGRRTTDRE